MFGPSSTQNLISTGNQTFDTFLGGGLLNSSLNIFERKGSASRALESIIEKSISATTLANKNDLIIINFNTESDYRDNIFLESLPFPKKVRSDLLYKDVRPKSSSAMKIAWRYTAQASSPSTSALRENQIDFGTCLSKQDVELGNLIIINIKKETFSYKTLIDQLVDGVKSSETVNIILLNLLHPFSPIYGDSQKLVSLLYIMRAFARTIERGSIVTSYDIEMCQNHVSLKSQIYNMADSVISFFTFSDNQCRLLGYKDIDGTVDYIKVPKINTLSYHLQRQLTDWGHRITKNNKYFVIHKLSLPPCGTDEQPKPGKASDILGVDNHEIKDIGLRKDFNTCVEDFFSKKI